MTDEGKELILRINTHMVRPKEGGSRHTHTKKKRTGFLCVVVAAAAGQPHKAGLRNE